jgi:hypothetical protein
MGYDKEAWLKNKQAEVEDALQAIKDGVANLVTSDDWKRHLDFQASFHRYSFRNTMLIAAQCPHATRVAGKGAWRKLGRKVVNWGDRIAILAPRIRKWKQEGDDGAEVEKQALIGWKTVYVYDVGATDGDELPKVTSFIEGNHQEDMLDSLIDVANDSQLVVEFRLLPGAIGGYIDHAEKVIVINKDRDVDHQVKTMIHELAHGLLHCDRSDEDVTRAVAEVEAESTAYVVCKALDIDTECYSFGYVAVWSGGDSEVVEKSGTRVARAAKTILSRIGEQLGANNGKVAA